MKDLKIPSNILNTAFQSTNGEYGWKKDNVPDVVKIFIENKLAILGGELWWVPKGSSNWIGLIPQKDESTVVYSWETKRNSTENWNSFVARCSSDTLLAIKDISNRGNIANDIVDDLFYNLTYLSEEEYSKLKHKAG